jgi:proteasome accessory factor B
MYSEKLPKASRWIDLVAFLLQHHFPVTREKIFSSVGGYEEGGESSRRKFERDKDELRALGIEIETVPLPDAAGDEPAMGYRLRPRQTYLPYLELVDDAASDKPYYGLDRIRLSREELNMLDRATRSLANHGDTPLSAAAASARRKLAFDLPLDATMAEQLLAYPVSRASRQALSVLQEAVIHHTAVTCNYYTMSRQADAIRELEPWGLMFEWGRWYCVARARDGDIPKVFRVDRMRDARPLKDGVTFDVPDDFDVRVWMRQTPWSWGAANVTRTLVRFTVPESYSVINQQLGNVVREEPGQASVIAFDVRDREPFLRWLLSFGRRAEVVEPESMEAALQELRVEIAARYAESSL